uniref:zinc transporter 2 isoform X2 n=1 Tax=Halichoerus grypus TaxID=9711 RepID=UPI0016598BBA|nr:zinc transporter 2 isoform X2 [Halichoerus grypus]
MEPTEKQRLVDARPGARSYTGSLWQEGTGWIPLPPSGLDLQAIELVTENNHYCHAQKGPGSHFDPKKERARRQLYVASAICLVFMIGEVVGGYLAHSLAVMTDAAHLLTDFASMLVSLFSLWMSSRPATKTMNFGWQRAEILGALLSVLSIWVVTGVLVFLAVERLISGDYEIEGGTMLITSGCAVAVNIIMGLTLHQSGHGHSHDTGQQQENPSVRAAFIHVIGDFLQSIGVLVAAYILYFKVLAPSQLCVEREGTFTQCPPSVSTFDLHNNPEEQLVVFSAAQKGSVTWMVSHSRDIVEPDSNPQACGLPLLGADHTEGEWCSSCWGSSLAPPLATRVIYSPLRPLILSFSIYKMRCWTIGV